jgi:hypothetical protein
MTPRFLVCLVASALIGLAAAVGAFVAGWGWLLTLLVYSVVGSVATLATAILCIPREPKAPQPQPVISRVLA